MAENPAAAPSTDPAAKPSIVLRAQYIKDLSFENPRAPASLFSIREMPAIEVQINLAAQRLDEAAVELSLHVALRAVHEKTTVFMVDLVYGGVFELRDIPLELVEQVVFVTGAQLIYPFARRVVADITRDGGFPSLQLDPIDFVGMYNERRAKQPA